MKSECLTVGQLKANCYLVWDEKTKKAVIIDPGDDADFIIRKIQDLRFTPQFVLTTHGHFDHVLAVTEIKLAFGIPFLMHQADIFLLKRSSETAKYFTGAEAVKSLMPDKFIKEGDLVEFGEEKLKVLETPGHTPGGVCFYTKKMLFSGDTLFANGVGRTDFKYASPVLLKKSLEKIFKFPASTMIYPGHGKKIKLGNLVK